MATIKLKVFPPRPPNYLKTETGEMIPVSDLQPDELDEIIREWGKALHKRAEEQAKEN
jgi:hypothetical protein